MTSYGGGKNAGGPDREGSAAGKSRWAKARGFLVFGGAAAFAAVWIAIAIITVRDSSNAEPRGVVDAAVVSPGPAAENTVAAATPKAAATGTIPVPTPSPQISTAATSAPTVEPTTSSVTVTPSVDGAWSSTPFVSTPAPGSDLGPSATALVSSLEAQYGVRIVTSGQDWGTDEATQLRNIGAVQGALAGVPASVLAAANANAGGALTLLSNHGGSTEAGWQPYGDREANYYTNEDIVNGRSTAANEIVLQPGSTSQTIAHETMHAYQMVGQAPGEFVLALLTPMMKSFMQATGWTQNVSDDQVRVDSGGSWDKLDHDYTYTGRTLTYAGADGSMQSLFAPNPLEAFAEAGGLYYAHAAGVTLPNWPEYWSWFAANVG